MEITESMRVQRVDFENDRTPAYKGFIVRIEPEEYGPTYWIQWEGTNAPDAHGRYAFAPLPDVPKGWTVVESMPLSQSHVVQVLQSGTTWAVRSMRPWGEYGLSFCASESDARELYASAIENGV